MVEDARDGLSGSGLGGRSAGRAGALFPVLVALFALAFIESLAPPPVTPATERAAPAAPTRLVVFWIDSLSDADLEDPLVLQRLKARLPEALHGRVTACADATSVPCFEAMATGWDRASLSTLFRNFGGHSARLEATGVFAALHARGKRLGFIGDPFVGGATGIFDWVRLVSRRPSAETVAAGLRALQTKHLDLVVIHLVEADAESHRSGTGPAYRRALNRIDAAVADGLSALRPTDHVAIVGDHGHTADGRHAPGLSVPTYAVYLGPLFARPLAYPMAMTDHASLWAAVFGLQQGNVPWVERYLAGRPLVRRTRYPVCAGSHRGVPTWGSLSVLGLAGLVVLPELRRLRPGLAPWRTLAALALGCAALVAGFVYLELRPALQGSFSDLRNVTTALISGTVGAGLLHGARARSGEPTAGLGDGLARLPAGFVLLALPTVYPFGGAAVALLGLLAAAAVLLWARVVARDWAPAAWAGSALLLGLTFRRVDMGGFQAFRFHFWRLVPAGWSTALATAGLFALIAILLLRRAGPGLKTRQWVSLAIGAAAWAAVPVLPPLVWLGPCVLALPAVLAALRDPRLDVLAFVLVPPALRFFYESDGRLLLPTVATLALVAVWSEATRPQGPGLRGAGLVVLLWLGTWVTFGCRAPGVRFQYFLSWVPPGSPVEDSWILNGLLTTAKYLLVPLMATLLTARLGGDGFAAVVRGAARLLRVRLALVLTFVVGYFLAGGPGGSNLVYDVVQELALCGLLALTAALAIVFHGRPPLLVTPPPG